MSTKESIWSLLIAFVVLGGAMYLVHLSAKECTAKGGVSTRAGCLKKEVFIP